MGTEGKGGIASQFTRMYSWAWECNYTNEMITLFVNGLRLVIDIRHELEQTHKVYSLIRTRQYWHLRDVSQRQNGWMLL